MLDTKLELFNGKPVVLVRPLFGTQSISYCGDLFVYDSSSSPFKCEVSTDETSTIFTSDDIKSTEMSKVENPSSDCPRLIITLKGPTDYVGESLNDQF